MMRSEQEIFALVLEVAEKYDSIRAVTLNGSRSNSNANKDKFQDYDIVYFLEDMKPFLDDQTWLEAFGSRVIMQTPEDMKLFAPSLNGWFTYLMLFEDHNRIDLMLVPTSDCNIYQAQEEPTVVLMDKDSLFSNLKQPSDHVFWVKKPVAACFDDCCNEFWWTVPYVVKGLYRGELLYSAEHMNLCVRKELLRMLSWKVGYLHDFQVNVGKCCRYLPKYMTEEEASILFHTYQTDTIEHCRQALTDSMNLFVKASRFLAKELGFFYPDYEKNVKKYLNSL